jgi:YcxB-like protein
MNDPIAVTFRWSAEEMLKAQSAQLRYSPAGKKLRRMYFLLIAVLIFGGVSILIRGISPVFGVGFLAGACGILAAPLRLRRMTLKRYAQRSDRDMMVNYLFSDQIVCKTEASSATMEWRMITRVLQTPGGFLLYPGRDASHWLPAHAFGDSESIQRFAQLAKSKVQNFEAAKV